ncbi:dinucleotide-utilizing enzyme [Microbacterium xanthum]|uniref:dinucleotide-utilizing enzyme n=1 Tax=Microbacterium xanthum TaxID=3079794 RepID=UPI002AD40F5B|nr:MULTISPECIES: dinucleotide-utilizing enzyme [unclassified Microbacterium]MDZ8172632.1 dinucleotide-utilizing enzyme [Microbacterium sp. KSW-48]MDZ8202531.1 dinucleotide-utilizing enzyme [Microbacterium sp. SSW1-59]
MTTRPRLVRSVPFWILLAGSAGTAGYGASMVTATLDSMTTTLLDGTATGVDVYVGQSTAVVGAILIGAGVIGVLLALAVAAAATLRPTHAAEVVEPPADADIDNADDADPALSDRSAETATPEHATDGESVDDRTEREPARIG